MLYREVVPVMKLVAEQRLEALSLLSEVTTEAAVIDAMAHDRSAKTLSLLRELYDSERPNAGESPAAGQEQREVRRPEYARADSATAPPPAPEVANPARSPGGSRRLARKDLL